MKRAVVVALACAGCSFATMRRPHGQPPECSTSRVPAVVDAVVAVASPIVAYAAVYQDAFPNSPDDTSANRGWKTFGRGVLAVGASFPVWLGFGLSSGYGFIRASACERAKRDDAARIVPPPVSHP